MEFASKVVERVTDFVLDLSVRHVAYIVNYGQNIDELNGSVRDLGLAKDRVDHQCDEAEKNLLKTEGTVTEWFRKVGEFETKVEEFGNDEGHTKIGLSNGLFPCLRNRHRLSRRAKEMAEDVKKLIDESSKFNEVAYRENVTSNDAILSNAGFVEFGSTKSTMEDIMAQLEDSTVRMVGLYGPGGVGKSTLIKEIAKRARGEKLFNVVAISEITANPNPQKIQEEIAYPLGLRLEGEGENVRADCLRRRLRKEKENTLIILDDLWDKLDLNKLGIPLDDDKDALIKDALMKVVRDDNDDEKSKMKNDDKDLYLEAVKKEKPLGDYKGCKILLTSRDKKVLADRMEVKSIFCVKELDDNDALMLFQKVAGLPDEISNFKQEIVKKYCAGLPMAVVTVGKALKDKSESVWKKTLDKLKNQELMEVQNSMEISVRMSYDHLENDELKSIFLLSAQMGHQPLVMDLVKYCFGLGILEGVSSLREARDRIHTSIQKLKDSSLMLEESSSYHFKLHDMVRDAALSIAREQNVFILRNGKLDDWPELKTCTSISICNSDIIDELPKVMNCPQLKFFQIDSDDSSLKIPDRFFEGMEKLRVLILSGIHLQSLPSSIKCLSNLRLLCLERCTLDDDLSIIEELKKLRILSFSTSQIENLPDKLGCLDKLQLLDLNNCTIKKMIPPNVISRLSCLEELYLRKSLIKMVEGETAQSQISFLSELKNLHQLKVVDLSIPCASVFPKDLFFDMLNDYKIEIGDFRTLSVGDFRMPNKYEAFKSLALQLKNDNDNIHSQKGIKLLLKRVENLLLGELNGVEKFIYELNLDGFPDLKHLSIIDNTHIKYIINSKDLFHSQDAFPKLESLCLYKVKNIEMICCSPVTDVSFTKLKIIKVEMCVNLKNLFSSYMVKFLASLETVDVSECDSLEGIVEIANSDKVELLKLQSFTLQSLPSFTGFHTTAERPSRNQLADAQPTNQDHIVIPIAEDNPPLFGDMVEMPNLESLSLSSIEIHKIWTRTSVSFHNIIKLAVTDCCNLRYLCSLSVASSLSKLKGLFISECPLMEKIFETDGNSANKVCVFPKLEEIHLSGMNMLTEIWQAEVSADSFSSIISLHIQGCQKLDKIFPSHVEGWFASLDSLKVIDCKSVEVIFEINSQKMDAFGGIDTNLQSIFIDHLPNLRQVWSIDPVGILNFRKLQRIEVSYCHKLRNVFRASVAKDAQKLEYLSVQYCYKMVEIVACKWGSVTINEPLVFPELTYMGLSSLSNIKHFYKGSHTIECPKLKKLTVYRCEKLKAFRTETCETINEEEKAVYSAEKVCPVLEYMNIDFDQAQKWLLSDTVKYQMQRLEELSLSSVESAELLCRFLYRMPNLNKLHLLNTDLEHLLKGSSVPGLGTVLQLKELTFNYSKIKDLGFQRDPVLQRLEHLSLTLCHKLIKLAPRTVSLTCLTYLEVKYCRGLRNLMASSTAKSLVQLKTLKVIRCDQVKEIVSNEDNVMEVVFNKLTTIELVALDYLTSFCSYENLQFKFPSLEILIVRECPAMKTFTENRHTKAPKLQNIIAVEGEEEAKWQWEGDLNATVQKVFDDKVTLSYTMDLSLSQYPEFTEQLWDDSYLVQQNNPFRNLKKLRAFGCADVEHVIPSHLLSCFENLEELKVGNCGAVRVIFNMNDETRLTKPLRLKKMSLEYLPKLEHVWEGDPEGIFGLQLLKEMSVENCDSLKSLFPEWVAKDLTRLEQLTVKKCRKLVEIFSKDEKAAEGVIEGFMSSRELQPEKQFVVQIHQQVCQIPSLKELTCSIGHTTITWDRESGQLCFDNLKRFEEDTERAPLYRFLHSMLPTVEKFKFESCSLEEMFSAERPNADYTKILLHLKGLEFCECYSLKNLVKRTVSFSNLTHLEVSDCWNLEYLLTSSTAKSLGRLKRVKIEKCGSLKEIVSKEGDESDENEEIVFEQLQVLYLEGLNQLRWFYPGNSTLRFPCLEKVYVMECSLMKSFSPVNIIEQSVEWFSEEDETPQQESHLNSAVARRFEEKIPRTAKSISNLKLKDRVDMQEIWQGSVPIPRFCFGNLQSLIVDGCQFLSDMVLPFNLLPFLTKLETLEVRNCYSVKTIFDVKSTKQDRIVTFPLKELTLSNLPNLENVWNEDPHGTLSMKLVQKVYVDNCKCLTSLFPESVANDLLKLEALIVQHCEGMMVIVAEDNAYQRGTNVQRTFPCMVTLTLCDLPKLEYQVCIEKLIDNLQHLALGENELKMISHGDSWRNKLKVLTLMNFHIKSSNVFPYGFLQQVPNIETIEVSWCSFEEILCFQSPNVDDSGLPSQLKVLTLEVNNCSGLKDFAALAVFSNLTCLFVFECHQLENLFTSSTVKSLCRLKIMEIKGCESIKEIVCMEGDGSNEDEIIFGQLLYLNLESLPKLTKFYKGSLSLPSLVQFSVINCCSMETLCEGTINADKLFEVTFENNSDSVPLEIDVNVTIQRTFLAKMWESAKSVSYLELRDRPDLQKIWHGSVQIPDLCFSNLHSLIADGCQFLSDVVLPFHLLPLLTNLKTLEVRNCYYVKTIFGIIQERTMTSPLKKLTLSKLPNLENVWNEDPHQILRMQLLEHVYVDNCKCLISVFPASVAEDLVELENLLVQNCEGLMTIVAEDNADPKGTNLELKFPRMKSLTLCELPKFKYFYYCSLQCDMLEADTNLEPHAVDQVCLQKLTPNLENLTLGENELKVIWHGEFQGNLLHKLKVLILLNYVDSNVFTYGCVQQVSNKEKLEVSCYSFKVIIPNVDVNGPQSHMKSLTLESLPEPFLRNLEFLEVSSCSCLANLAPLHVCFSNLTCLFVFECHRLENLLTSSTAKSLSQLRIMEIKDCESIKEIVFMEGDGSNEDEIIFGKLLCLNLEYLPNLTMFYKGSLSLPSLVQFSVINCHNMENLCEGTVNADKLVEVKFQNNSDAIPLEIDLNSTIQKALHATAFDFLSSSSSDTNEDGQYSTPRED